MGIGKRAYEREKLGNTGGQFAKIDRGQVQKWFDYVGTWVPGPSAGNEPDPDDHDDNNNEHFDGHEVESMPHDDYVDGAGDA